MGSNVARDSNKLTPSFDPGRELIQLLWSKQGDAHSLWKYSTL